MESDTGEEQGRPRDRVVVVTDPVVAEGFILGGAEVYSFLDARKAREKIHLLLHDDTIKVLIVNEKFLRDIGDSDRNIIESSKPPAVVTIPAAGTEPGSRKKTSLLDLIRKSTPRM